MVQYVGTRGDDGIKPDRISFSDAILSPSAGYGGLYVPSSFKKLSEKELKSLFNLSYQELAFQILTLFGVDIDSRELRYCLMAYSKFDNGENPSPVVKLDANTFVQELWHGPTRSFKDIALQTFSRLLSYLAICEEKDYLIATSTSGDTGPAALSGFKDLLNTRVVVFYPVGGTSVFQEEQMLKSQGENVKVVGVRNTNFDSIQSVLKKMLKSDELNEKLVNGGFELSAANSVNFGRIVFQIVYHFWSYFELVRNGEICFGDKVNVVIPSGNFGNSLGCFYAKIMGIPIKKIVLASNENNVLTEFVNTGIYDIRERLVLRTNSPAMDINISSNMERLLNYLFGENRTFDLMNSLERQNYFELTALEKNVVQDIFSAGFATDEEVLVEIKSIFNEFNYLIDPHTATAFVVRHNLGIYDKAIILSTAEWTKFAETIAEAFGLDCNNLDSITDILNVKYTYKVFQVNDSERIHDTVIDIDDMYSELLKFID
jgi:threonine synthase